MAIRPRVFEQKEVEDKLHHLGVPGKSISPTVSFMRLLIPALIRDVGFDRAVEIFTRASAEVGLRKNSAWARKMLPDVVKWADACLEDFKSSR